ncbi:hypothetical protein EJ377_15810 [Chryseobacterium arthrosphaerae]|uniref:Uncharacterized protein n=1 Tax=Chryseobacterium arthrosphaerae TaxID=651561 RepID=A0A3S0N1J6_9FLAO|nr:hypothetical protein EJ377_15810 [Chryseobacterium arthrosphaerae]
MNVAKNVTIIILLAAVIGLIVFSEQNRKAAFQIQEYYQAQLKMISSRTQPLAQTGNSEFSNISVEEIDENGSEADRKGMIP